jgi:hypothetical protein
VVGLRNLEATRERSALRERRKEEKQKPRAFALRHVSFHGFLRFFPDRDRTLKAFRGSIPKPEGALKGFRGSIPKPEVALKGFRRSIPKPEVALKGFQRSIPKPEVALKGFCRSIPKRDGAPQADLNTWHCALQRRQPGSGKHARQAFLLDKGNLKAVFLGSRAGVTGGAILRAKGSELDCLPGQR